MFSHFEYVLVFVSLATRAVGHPGGPSSVPLEAEARSLPPGSSPSSWTVSSAGTDGSSMDDGDPSWGIRLSKRIGPGRPGQRGSSGSASPGRGNSVENVSTSTDQGDIFGTSQINVTGSAGETSLSSEGSAGTSSGYMETVDDWMAKLGIRGLKADLQLAANAQNTSSSSGGALNHNLNTGSMAQVMAPGNEADFESVFVGGWLCELPSLPGLGSAVCSEMGKGYDHAGQTGHAEILTSPTYASIGCGLAQGIWMCDLA